MPRARSEKGSCGTWATPLLKRKNHTVICRLDTGGKLGLQRPVVEVDMHVGQDGALRFQPLDPGERFGQAEMARMRYRAQGIDDPQIEIAQRRETLIGNVADIRRIGDIADTETKRGDVAMRE